MNASSGIFYLLSAFILGGGLLAVTSRKIFRAAVWLLFSLTGVAGLYFWMQVNFIAAVQVIVYVGGIVVLILFSIFLTQQSGRQMPAPSGSRVFFSLAAAVFGCAFTGWLIYSQGFSAVNRSFNVEMADIGTQLLSTGSPGYALPFEAVSMLLLAGMVGCIVIAMKQKPEQ